MSISLKLLLVCHANVCRSPIAEAVFHRALADEPGLELRSAGLAALAGAQTDPLAARLLVERGYALLPPAAARAVGEATMHWADLVLVMEAAQRRALLRRYPFAVGRVWLLGHWLDCDIPDPYGRGEPVLLAALSLIEACVESWRSPLSSRFLKEPPVKHG